MPARVDVQVRAALRVPSEDVSLVVDVRQGVGLGVGRGDGEARLLELAETLAEVDLLIVSDVLISEYEHAMPVPGRYSFDTTI